MPKFLDTLTEDKKELKKQQRNVTLNYSGRVAGSTDTPKNMVVEIG